MSATLRRSAVDGRAIALVIGMCALWGLQQVAIKQAVAEGLPPFLQGFLRSAGAALLVAAWIRAREGSGALQRIWRNAGWASLLLAIIFAAEFLLLYPGLRLTTASRGVLFLYTAPFFTALFAHAFLPAERLRPRQGLGLAIAFGGVALAFASGLSEGGGSFLGDGMCTLAALGWGINTVLVKASPNLRATPSAGLLLFQLGGSAPILAIGAWIAGNLSVMPHATAFAWGALFYQTVIVAFASYLVWFWLVTAYPATVISGFTFLTPLFGILAGALLLGEPTPPELFAGLAAVAVGMHLLR